MKIIITESQKKLLFENSMNQTLINSIKEDGFESASELVGGSKNLLKLLKIKDPMDFLNLFNDLDVVQSKENPEWTLYRYKPKHNLMVYDQRNGYVFVYNKDIWSVLENDFVLNYSDIQDLMKVWLGEVYNLRGVTPVIELLGYKPTLDEVYNLRGVTPVASGVYSNLALDEVYNLKNRI